MKNRLTLWTRESRPVAYGLPVFGSPSQVQELLLRIKATQLRWAWMCHPTPFVIPETGAMVPDYGRELTDVSDASAHDFVRDVQEREPESGYRHYVALFGLDADSRNVIVSEASLKPALARFCMLEAAPVRVVVVQIGDQDHDLVFLPHKPSSELAEMMSMWGIGSAGAAERPYSRLRATRLEAMFLR